MNTTYYDLIHTFDMSLSDYLDFEKMAKLTVSERSRNGSFTVQIFVQLVYVFNINCNVLGH